MTSEPLSELLRRCHRAELVPLAEVLQIQHQQLGLDRLSVACDVMLRRRGAQDLVNALWRRGQGPSYEVVLAKLAKRFQLNLEDEASVEAIEDALCERWVEEVLPTLPHEDRQRVRARLSLGPLPAGQAETALVRVGTALQTTARIGGLTALAVVARVLVTLFPPLMPVAGFATLWWLGRVQTDVIGPAVIEVRMIRQAVRHRVTLGVVGSPSSGKDAGIRAIFGIDSGNVNPIAGSTSTVEVSRLDHAQALFVVNTPGMGDVVESVTAEAKQMLDLIDVYVYVLNAQGGVQAREKADYKDLVARGRPVLVVVNKVDTLREHDLERYLADARQKLAVDPSDFLPVAFDPLPQLSDKPIGIGPVRNWLDSALASLGKPAGLYVEGDASTTEPDPGA